MEINKEKAMKIATYAAVGVFFAVVKIAVDSRIKKEKENK